MGVTESAEVRAAIVVSLPHCAGSGEPGAMTGRRGAFLPKAIGSPRFRCPARPALCPAPLHALAASRLRRIFPVRFPKERKMAGRTFPAAPRTLFRRHADGAVEAQVLAVEVGVADQFHDQAAELLGLAEALGERHRGV